MLTMRLDGHVTSAVLVYSSGSLVDTAVSVAQYILIASEVVTSNADLLSLMEMR